MQDAPLKKQYNCFFHERPKFQEKMTFEKAFWIKCGKKNTKSNIRALYNFRRLYTGCSAKEAILLLLSRDT